MSYNKTLFFRGKMKNENEINDGKEASYFYAQGAR